MPSPVVEPTSDHCAVTNFIWFPSRKDGKQCGTGMYRHFQRHEAFENEGIEKSHFSIPFQKRPMEGRFWTTTI
jgi:hypothetical protein